MGPTRIGRFEILGELGRGGMGQVFEARDPELGRVVALKVLANPRFATEATLSRFLEEARLASRLDHPGIVPVYETGRSEEGLPYFVMRRVQGCSLRQLIDELRRGLGRAEWPLRRRVGVMLRVCEAVAYAHDRGVLHRDLKPGNVMLGDFGEVLVLDWGLAGGEADGLLLGTPGRMSPEQAGESPSHPVDERSDVWGLGLMLRELLCLDADTDGAEDGLPAELGQVLRRAMSWDPTTRTPGAQQLRDELAGWSDGSSRAEQAERHLASARAAWRARQNGQKDALDLRSQVARLEREVPGWAPLDHPAKAALHSTRERLAELDEQVEVLFARAVSAAERARACAPELPGASKLLAEAWWSRFEQAERRGDRPAQARYAQRVLEHDTGTHAALLRGQGALSLDTSPPGAEVLCRRWTQRGLVWELGPPRSLGRTPLRAAPLAMGSYQLTLSAPGFAEALYPVCIGRGAHWAARGPVPLLRPSEQPPGSCYVPAGPFVFGGDPQAGFAEPRGDADLAGFLIARFPVTVRDYVAFLQSLPDPEAASRAPRLMAAQGAAEHLLLGRDAEGRWALPQQDQQGDRWHPDWPVFAVSHDDASAFAAWRGARLPLEHEWEKAARGVDGRLHPWGDGFDPALCWMQGSVPGRSRPSPIGARPADCSPYGVRDLAGGVRGWCGDPSFRGDPGARPVRGGAWSGAARLCRAANRFHLPVDQTRTWLGFRLAWDLPPCASRGSTV